MGKTEDEGGNMGEAGWDSLNEQVKLDNGEGKRL